MAKSSTEEKQKALVEIGRVNRLVDHVSEFFAFAPGSVLELNHREWVTWLDDETLKELLTDQLLQRRGTEFHVWISKDKLSVGEKR